MSATIDKNNGNDPVRYRFLILMDKEEGDCMSIPTRCPPTISRKRKKTVVPDNIEAMYTLAPRMT
jgi:hypothetical protein